MLFVGTRFSSLYTATVRDPRPELPASGVTKSKEEEEEEEEEEEDLFIRIQRYYRGTQGA